MGDVRNGLDELVDWIGGGRKEVVAAAKDSIFKAANDLWGDNDEKVIEYLRNRGFNLWQAKDSVAYARQRWPEKKQVSRFGVISGLTAVAGRLGMDGRYELERQTAQLFTA